MTSALAEPPQRESWAFPTHAAVGRTWHVFDSIRMPDINLCIWGRPQLTELANRLAAVATPPVTLRAPTSPASFRQDIEALLQAARLDPVVHALWIADMQILAERFFREAQGRDAGLRLEFTVDDGCRRYHVDRSYLRLICTYRGPGTEWLANAQVCRESLSSGAPNEHIVQYGLPQRLAPMQVGLFKGRLYPETVDGGLVHRSPPIAGTHQSRIVFCLDC